jgi:hypothetical protein
MSVFSRLVRFVTGTPDTPRTHVREAAGMTIDEDAGWTRLGADRKRDLSPISQRRMQELAAHQWEANRIANRLIELPTAFLLGEGVKLEADDPEAQKRLDRFWSDPLNRMDLNLEKHVRELALFGEQLWPVSVHPYTGFVRLKKLDPSDIEKVILDPDNVAAVIGVQTRNRGGKRKLFRVIYNAADEDLFSPPAQKLRAAMTDGDCFYYRINDLSSGARGRSDLLSAIDYADVYDQLLFGEAEGSVIKRAVLWDVTVKNATQEEVEERARNISAPEPNSIRVHNDNEEWQVLTPDLKSSDADTISRLIRNHILGGATVPEHWFGGGGDVNLATASSMGEPTYKVFSQRQRLLKAILEDVARYVLRQYALSLGIPEIAETDEWQPRALFPELTARDVAKYAAALQQVTVSCAQAVTAGVMSEDTAVRLIALVAGLLGLEIDPAEELTAARAEASKRREADAFTLPPMPVTPPVTAAEPAPGDAS